MSDPRDKPQTSTNEFDCLRCALALTGRSLDDAPEHSRQCPLRGTGKDPQPKDLVSKP